MMIPSRRKLGAAALIIAGIGAFLVPFLLHSPATQGTSNNNGRNPTTPNPTTPTTPTPTTPSNPGSKDDGKDKGGSGGGTTDTGGTCTGEKADHSDASDQTGDSSTTESTTDLSVSHNANGASTSDNSKAKQGHAFGLLKNQLDTTVALMKAMGTHNTVFNSHHDTKTDNHTVHAQPTSSENSNDNSSSCAETEETNDD